MSYPEQLKYTKDHEWAELISETQIRVGITAHAQNSLGDIVYLELPKAGRDLKDHETFGVVESIKAVSDLYSPIAGKVVQSNSDLAAEPGRINSNPHGEWMLVLESTDAKKQFESLLTSSQYQEFIRSL
jgi:glycine cleavage system H protein